MITAIILGVLAFLVANIFVAAGWAFAIGVLVGLLALYND